MEFESQNAPLLSDRTASALYQHWTALYDQAKAAMAARSAAPGILIEVAAQHPLVDGRAPNEEFSKRLTLAAELYFSQRPLQPVKLYVPGSLHTPDQIPLSQAGKDFLLSLGVAEEDIFAEEANRNYKGEEGVYNSTDECFVASSLFRDLGYGHLHCVCSSAQMMRKALSYIQFGFVPYFHTVSCDRMYHSYVDEVFRYIPILLDGTAFPAEADRLRRLRKPSPDE